MISDAVYEHALAERDAALARAEWLWQDCDEKYGQIKAAEARVAELEQALDAALDEIRGIVRYLDSPDFDDRERLLMVRAACADGLARAALGDPS